MSQATLTEVEQLAATLTFEDQLRLLERVVQLLRSGPMPRQPQDLYGAFQGQFPEDFDVDSALHEIRTAWKADLNADTGEQGGESS